MERARSIFHRSWGLLKAAMTGWWQDNVPRMGASLAYYTLFALAPVLILVIAVGGLLFGADAVRGQVYAQIQGLMGREGARTIQDMLEAAGNATPQATVAVGAILTFFMGATGAFLELQGSLNTIWRAAAKSSGSVLRDLIFQRLISFGLVMGFAFLLLTALVVSAGLAAVSAYVGARFPGGPLLWKGLDLIVSLAVITLLFALIYKVMPDCPVAWRQAWVGAGVTAVLFGIGKSLIGVYLGASSITSTYGAAGSVIVVLVWVYYSSQIVLLGAEFTKAYGDAS